MQKAPVAVHHRSACSGVKALRNTSDARRHAAKLCYRFGPLTPSARSANLIAGDGTKNGFPAPNKKPAKNQKRPLDRKSPIQVRIPLPPAQSQVRTSPRFGTGRIVILLGVGVALALLPALTMVGFGVLVFAPGLGTIAVFQVFRRAAADHPALCA
jgi:hypothetical protein